jgi:hypothetical protein
MTFEERRAEIRAAIPRPRVKGWAHFACIMAFGASAALLAAFMVEDLAWWEWLAVPGGFLVANLVEWFMHKNPMHHPTRGLGIMYQRHTLEHHRYFSNETMEVASPEDFDLVLFTLPSLAMFLLGTGLPIALLIFWLVSANAGWLFVALAVDYYALYEFFHLAYHLPGEHWIARLPGMPAMRRHHTFHHDESLMSRWNFNVTFPIFDAAFGTRWKG